MEGETVRIIALNGSPHRNGNTATLMGWVLDGCVDAGAQVEWIHIIDQDIRYCQGCHTCLRTGACPIEDDCPTVRDRLLAADGIVVGSPVYESHPTAQMCTLLDRLTLLNLYTATFAEQRTVGVATSGVAPTRGLARYLANFFGRRVGVIGARTADLSGGYQPLARGQDLRMEGGARRLGRRLVAKTRSRHRVGLPTPSMIWIDILRRFVVRPLIERNADQFSGVLRIWSENGWL